MVGLPKKEVKSKRTTAEVWKKAMAKPQIKQEHHKNFGFWIRFLRKDGGHRSGENDEKILKWANNTK